MRWEAAVRSVGRRVTERPRAGRALSATVQTAARHEWFRSVVGVFKSVDYK